MHLLSTRTSSSGPSQSNKDPEGPPRRSPLVIRVAKSSRVYLPNVSCIDLRPRHTVLLKQSLTPLPGLCSSFSKRILCRVVSRILPEHKVDEVSRSCLKPPCGSHCLRTGPPWPPVTWPCPPAPAHCRVRRLGRGCHRFTTARPRHVCMRPLRTPPDGVICPPASGQREREARPGLGSSQRPKAARAGGVRGTVPVTAGHEWGLRGTLGCEGNQGGWRQLALLLRERGRNLSKGSFSLRRRHGEPWVRGGCRF